MSKLLGLGGTCSLLKIFLTLDRPFFFFFFFYFRLVDRVIKGSFVIVDAPSNRSPLSVLLPVEMRFLCKRNALWNLFVGLFVEFNAPRRQTVFFFFFLQRTILPLQSQTDESCTIELNFVKEKSFLSSKRREVECLSGKFEELH